MSNTRAVRRRHKKSRWGCHDCKQRHIKCDEHRPVCVNCSVAGRQCSFTSTVPSVPSISAAASAAASPHLSPVETTTTTTPTAASSSTPQTQSQPQPHSQSHSVYDRHDHTPRDTPSDTPAPSSDTDSIPPANMAQLELMRNVYKTNLDLPYLASMSAAKFQIIFLDLAARTPFLMNELLAFSSRHLAEVHPKRAAHYQHQALQLQTHALRMFNEERHEFQSPDTCMAVIFFSWLIGNHMLSDVLGGHTISHRPDENSSERTDTDTENSTDTGTLDRFFTYMRTYRGLRTITSTTWEVILTTDFAHVINDGIRRLELVSEGPETAPLKEAVRAALAKEHARTGNTDDDIAESKSFDTAIARIQWAVDTYNQHKRAGTPYQEDIVKALSMWTLVIDKAIFPRFIDKHPVALAVLAHYTVMLYWCRDVWIFGDVGALLLEDIARSVPAEWKLVLAWPMEVVQTKTTTTTSRKARETR